MTSPTPSDNSFQADQTPNHTNILAQAGGGKSMLITPILIDELQKRNQKTKD